MRTFRLSNKSYFVAFVFVMILNVSLAAFLIRNVLAQTSDDKLKNQPPIVAEVLEQENSPLLISITNIDNSNESYQTVSYAAQNLSSKKIRAYVLVHADETEAGGASIQFFESFDAGKTIQSSFFEEQVNIKTNSKILLSVDYVEFSDGSSWGKDVQQQSEYIAGHYEGRKIAVKQVKDLLKNKNAVLELMQQQLTEITPPSIDNKKSDRWQRGLIAGYRTLLTRLQITYETQGAEAISSKLEQIEKFTKKENK